MSSKQGIKTVDIEGDTYQELSDMASKQNTSIRKFINQVLRNFLDTSKILIQFFADFSLAGLTDNAVLIEDKKRKDVAKITVSKDTDLMCSICKKNFCEHIYVAMVYPHSRIHILKLTLDLKRSQLVTEIEKDDNQ